MNPIFLLSLLLLAAPANVPVRITVEPCKRTNPNLVTGAPRLTPGSRASIESLPADLPNTVAQYFHVKVANVSPKPLKSLQVRWTIVWVDEANKYRLTEGKQTCDIAPVRTFEFDTDAIGVRSGKSNKVDLIQKQQVVGYLIEVLLSDIVIASEGKPKDIEPFITRLRAPVPK